MRFYAEQAGFEQVDFERVSPAQPDLEQVYIERENFKRTPIT
jgi:hypothetical protein